MGDTVAGRGPDTRPGPTCAGDLERFSERLRALEPSCSVVVRDSSEYPSNLAGVEGAPAALFVRGTLLASDSLAVAVVGTRRASAGGLARARHLAAELAGAGVCVVSGLARGIDAAAHAGALSAGGRTVAVLGSGLGCVYPPEHRELAAEIAAAGAVVSQWWPWTPPAPEQFRRRNAVSSGLALATVVVEASARSGARLQARLARSQGRLLCVSEAVAASEDWARVLVSASSAVVVRG
ncbi:MAG: DNA-processing protein DprA, partial [Acidimicrobiales bacterium]